MNQRVFAVCDSEETHAFRLSEYMMEKITIPHVFHIFTKTEELVAFLGEESIDVLVVAENCYTSSADLLKEKVSNLFVLQETEQLSDTDVNCIDKYQSPENIVRAVIDGLDSISGFTTMLRKSVSNVKLIGLYSPIRRCLQTSFALTLGQILAQKKKVLYVNFEYYSGLDIQFGREFTRDMMDAVYYYICAKDKFALQIPMIVQNLNGLDYLPPMKNYVGMKELSGQQWLDFLRLVGDIGKYDYIILDLEDSINDIFEVLMQCNKIYTIVKEDPIAKAKLLQYEQILHMYAVDEIADRTVKCRFPYFEHLPEDISLMTYGDLAHYVQEIVKEDIYGQL